MREELDDTLQREDALRVPGGAEGHAALREGRHRGLLHGDGGQPVHAPCSRSPRRRAPLPAVPIARPTSPVNVPSRVPARVSSWMESGRLPPTRCSSRRSSMARTGRFRALGELRRLDVPRLDAELGAEAAAHVRREHAHLARPSRRACGPGPARSLVDCVLAHTVADPSASSRDTVPWGSRAEWVWICVRHVPDALTSASATACFAHVRVPAGAVRPSGSARAARDPPRARRPAARPRWSPRAAAAGRPPGCGRARRRRPAGVSPHTAATIWPA